MTPPVFSHGSLRLYLLMLLAEQPRHGYELIQALSDRFGGTYVPSAGTIYPRLAKLEEEGLVTKQSDGRKTVYAITDAGRAELAAREGELHSIESDVTDSVRRRANEVRAGVNQAMKSLRADLASAAREARAGSADGSGSDGGTADSGPTEPGSTQPGTTDGTGTGTGTGSGSGTGTGSADADGAIPGGAGTASGAFPGNAESTRAVHDADVALTGFRQKLRTELRKRSVRGQVAPSVVELLERRLEEVRTEVLAALDNQH